LLVSTPGLVLKSIKYGETSLIVQIFTQKLGLGSYIINGVRTSKSPKAAYFNAGNILQLVVYQNQTKHLQHIKEYSYAHSLDEFSINKKLVITFMIEVLHKCLHQPEQNEELFNFLIDCYSFIISANQVETANFSAYYLTHLSHFFGFQFLNNYNTQQTVANIKEGEFESESINDLYSLGPETSLHLNQFLKANQPGLIGQIALNRQQRLDIIDGLLRFYHYHLPSFTLPKSLPVLQTLFS
jgi:DNA repair protein RecO (recombination protein O)